MSGATAVTKEGAVHLLDVQFPQIVRLVTVRAAAERALAHNVLLADASEHKALALHVLEHFGPVNPVV